MLKIEKNRPLAPYTTFKIGPDAEFFAIIKSRADILEAINWARENKKPIFILGGGSNLLLTKKIKGLVIKNEIKGMEVLEKNETYVLVEGKSGELWAKFVNFAVSHDFYGLENLFLIPGTVGAAPMQNIGAYGVELKDVFYHLKAIDLKTGHEKIFSAKECGFNYRHSVFKTRLKGKYFIYSLTVKLSRQPNFKLDYGDIRQKLKAKGITDPKLSDLSKLIQEIRNSKLPNPAVLPNAGSFFQNPLVKQPKLITLKRRYPDLPYFVSGRLAKLPAGWLIDKAGFKGKKFGPVRMYEKQALVMVNHGQAEAKHVLALAKKVKAAVKKKFGVDLKEEVNII